MGCVLRSARSKTPAPSTSCPPAGSIAHTAAIQHVGKETIVYGPTLTVPIDLEITPGVHATWIA